MKNLFYAMAAMIVALVALTGCKTTEENYQRAYEVAKAKKTEGLTQSEIDGLQREEALPMSVYMGDSIPLKGMYVTLEDANGDVKLLTYNVVVSSFKQRFNAQSACGRMRNGGYPNAILLVDRDERYYVAAQTTASLDSAVAIFYELSKNAPVAMRSPFPYILRACLGLTNI